jgi:hypothetical protein
MNSRLSLIKAASNSNPIRREMPIEPKVLDEKKGIMRFVASDETMDHSREIVRLKGWRFTNFSKNAPFPDSHDYSSITKNLGQVVTFAVEGGALVEDVQFALTPKGDTLADWAFAMYRDKFLRACSVGFMPTKYATRWDTDKGPLLQQMNELKLDDAARGMLACVYIEQEQIELSACVLGCNPNALAKSVHAIAGAYKAGTIGEHAVDSLSAALAAASKNASPAASSADADDASPRTKLAVIAAIQALI